MSNINNKRCEIFIKVGELGNITKVAESIDYTQSGISHVIETLEKED